MSELSKVPIGSIQQSASQLREVDPKAAKVLNMIESMKSVGVLSPISVHYVPNKDTGENELVLIDGAHRLYSARQAGLTEMPVHILDLGEAEVLIAQMIGNLHRVETKPYQFSRQLNRLAALNPNMTVGEMAEKIGETTDYVKSRLAIAKLDPEVGKYVDSGAIVPMAAVALAKLPAEDQVEFANKAMKAESATKFAEEVNVLLKDRRAAADAARKEGLANGTIKPVDPAESETIYTPRCRKAGDIKLAYNNAQATVGAIVNDAMTPQEAGEAVLTWIMQMDTASIEARRAAAIQRAAAEEERRKKSAEDNKGKKLESLAAKMEALKAEMAGKVAANA